VTCSATCGDGLTVATEQCDDSGTVDGDGCNDSCQLEIPSCSLTFSPTTGSVPLIVTGFETVASGSTWIVYDELDRGDAVVTSGPTFPAVHTYSLASQYTATLTVSNSLS